MRPTLARANVLSALEKAAPSCLDTSQMYRILSTQFDSLTPGSVYRALNDLWTAGLLVRTDGASGRAFYAIKPEALNDQYDTLRCYCGARLVFVEDRALHEHLQSLASSEGFALDEESVFTIITTCAKCRQLRKEGQLTTEGGRRSRAKAAWSNQGEISSGSMMPGTGASSALLVRSERYRAGGLPIALRNMVMNPLAFS